MSSTGYTRLQTQEEEELKPPTYQPEEPKTSTQTPPAYSPPSAVSSVPPSYEQAERLKRDADYDTENQRTDDLPERVHVGGYCEFFVFFLICFVFGWVGYLFACCFMVTVAASTGSAAGFGLYLVQTAVFINLGPQDMWGQYRYHYSGSQLNSSTSNRNYYDSNDAVARDSSYFFGWLLWFLAFCGVLLFFKSLITFGQAKNQERRRALNLQ